MCLRFSKDWGIKVCTIEDLVQYLETQKSVDGQLSTRINLLLGILPDICIYFAASYPAVIVQKRTRPALRPTRTYIMAGGSCVVAFRVLK